MSFKNISLFAFAGALLALGACKKTCKFPERQEGNKCWEIRQDYIGQYRGYESSYDSLTGLLTKQLIMRDVRSETGDLTVMNAGRGRGLQIKFDENGLITIPDQPIFYSGTVGHATGTGYFADSAGEKMIVLDFVCKDDSIDNSLTVTFTGFR